MSRNKTTKILLFAKHLDGGTGTFAAQMKRLEVFSRQPTEVKVFALERPRFRLMQGNFTIEYFSDKQLLPYSYLLTPAAIINTFREFFWLKKIVGRYRPDIIISVDNHCNVLVCMCRLLFFRTKIILTIHNNVSAVIFSKLPSYGRALFKQVCRFLFLRADEIVCVSRGVAVDAKSFFSLPTLPRVIYIGINAQRVQQLAREQIATQYKDIFNSKKIKIVTIGRFAPQKDFDTLFRAFALFRENQKNAELCIIGDGAQKELLVSLARTMGIAGVVHFLGWQQNPYSYIHASDLFVLSSHYEGFPYVLLEAGALGKPIVSTDSPYGPRELLEDNVYGLLVPMKNPSSLARALKSLMDKKVYSHYQSQIKKRSKRFSEDIMLERYQSLIESLA